MENHGLFSTLFIRQIKNQIEFDDSGRGRMASAAQTWHGRDASSRQSLWQSFLKPVLGYLEFVSPDADTATGIYPLFEDWGFSNCITALCLIPPGADLDEVAIGRFWPGLLIAELKRRRLTWGILTDGARWRLYSTRSARPFEDYVELPLAGALEGNDEVEYALFERFFHRDSFLPESKAEGGAEKGTQNQRIVKCRLDRDGEVSEEVLENTVKNPLLYQVDEVLQYLCNGFIQDTPKSGMEYTEEERAEIFQCAVKLLYRCLFLFYAEARRLLPTDAEKRAAYERLSIQSLCREARRFRWGQRKDFGGYDLWQHLKGLVAAVNEGDIEYGILGYNGGLFDDEEEKYLGRHRLRNDFLWRALYLLAYVESVENNPQTEYAVPYEDLEVRHLGELYENLLEYTVILADADRIRRRTKRGVDILLASNTTQQPGDSFIRKGDVFFGESALERKQTGSYYTPESLVQFLNEKSIVEPLRQKFDADCRSRLDAFLGQMQEQSDLSVCQGAARSAVALVERFVQDTVLSFKVCDPAMGSGHFLVNAANQIAGLVVGLLSEIPEVSGTQTHLTCQPNLWRRLVTRHCLYGVDLNPLAVDLAKLSLWLNSFAGAHKLTFLDNHLRIGNSLIGIRTLEQLQIIPDRKSQGAKKSKQKTLPLFDKISNIFTLTLKAAEEIPNINEDDTEQQKTVFDTAKELASSKLIPVADLYTLFLMDKRITEVQYQQIYSLLVSGRMPQEIEDEGLEDTIKNMERFKAKHHFFHWPLEFPDIFRYGEKGGFDAAVGNPPWDKLKPNSKEFFSAYDSKFRFYKKQQANQQSNKLMQENPRISERWIQYCEGYKEQSAYFREPSAFKHLGQGDIDTFKLFLESFYNITKYNGYLGTVIPGSFTANKGTTLLRKLLLLKSRIQFVYSFENRWPKIFTAVADRKKIIVFGSRKGEITDNFKCAFMQHDPERLWLIDNNCLRVSLDLIRKFSPSDFSIMEFKDQKQIEVSDVIFHGWPPLGRKLKECWNVQFRRELDMTNDSALFKDYDTGYPLLDGRCIWHFDSEFSLPRYWIDYTEASQYRKLKGSLWEVGCYRVTYRDIASADNERTLSACISPPAFHGNKAPTVVPYRDSQEYRGPNGIEALYLTSVLSSFVMDFVIRNKVIETLNFFFLYSLPVPRLTVQNSGLAGKIFGQVAARAARLTCISTKYSDFWRIVFRNEWKNPEFWYPSDCNLKYGPSHEANIRKRLRESAVQLSTDWTSVCGLHDRLPGRRDSGDRAQFRAEIDACIAHLYGLTRPHVEHILDSLRVLKKNEMKCFGEYQSRRKCLEEFDRIQTILNT